MYETEGMTQEEKNEIYDVLRNLEGIEKAEIKKREEYISLDCLGGSASKEERERWDPNGNKRLVIRGRLDELLKGRFDLFMAGRATIDIVAKGKNKADNTVRLAKVLNIPLKDVIFTGDEFRVYGNDYPLLSLKDIQVNIVNNPEETLEIIKKM